MAVRNRSTFAVLFCLENFKGAFPCRACFVPEKTVSAGDINNLSLQVQCLPPSTTTMGEVTNVTVLVRVRPPLPREQDNDWVVEMPADEPGATYLKTPLSSGKNTPKKKYVFDDSIWSFDSSDANYTDNLAFYRKSGPLLIDHFFQGYNVCLLAYGQTGSGKTFTMMGDEHDPGLIPLMIRDILRHKDSLVRDKINCELRFSYVEIYNEKVRDLLDGSRLCRVREHPSSGPYVENVADHRVDSYDEFLHHLAKGNANRTVAATLMNDTSSRSHAVITFTLKQTRFSSDEPANLGDAVEEMVSNIKLVDLAGSERLSKTKVFGQAERMKEGTQINKSLTVLGRCINILAQPGKQVVPYRDSTLTYLLRENLAGNSKTAMIFCVSPGDYEETHQTLNYASQVKKMKTVAKANSSAITSAPVDWDKLKEMDKTVIDTLKEQIERLTAQLEDSQTPDNSVTSLIRYLERESGKQTFEIKYLKDMLAVKDTQIAELQGQNSYLHGELSSNARQNVMLEHGKLALLVAELNASCSQHAVQMQRHLVEFEPNFFLN